MLELPVIPAQRCCNLIRCGGYTPEIRICRYDTSLGRPIFSSLYTIASAGDDFPGESNSQRDRG